LWIGTEESPSAQIIAINTPVSESDPQRMPPEEFKLRFGSAWANPDQEFAGLLEAGWSPSEEASGKGERRHLWRVVLAGVFVFFLFESWYAARLIR
jgi:hypothetical protein